MSIINPKFGDQILLGTGSDWQLADTLAKTYFKSGVVITNLNHLMTKFKHKYPMDWLTCRVKYLNDTSNFSLRQI